MKLRRTECPASTEAFRYHTFYLNINELYTARFPVIKKFMNNWD